MELKHDLLTSKYTNVYHEGEELMQYNAPHSFEVARTSDGENFAKFIFKKGQLKNAALIGVCNEDLIAMVICRT